MTPSSSRMTANGVTPGGGSPAAKTYGSADSSGRTSRQEVGGRGYGISPYTVAGEPEPAWIRTPPVIIQPPTGGIWLSLAKFSR